MPPIEPRVTFEDAIAVARDHGFEYIVFNYLAPEERLGLDFYRALADKLNTAAQKCRSAGLRFCYHNHDFEFEPKPTHKPMEILLERLDKNLIGLEVDTFWVSMAGVDAAAFLKQNAGRVELVHLKDRAPGTPVHYDIATSRRIRFASSVAAICRFGKFCPPHRRQAPNITLWNRISAVIQSGV
jgi:sugar phosphate isomerase/epimerase